MDEKQARRIAEAYGIEWRDAEPEFKQATEYAVKYAKRTAQEYFDMYMHAMMVERKSDAIASRNVEWHWYQ